MIAYRLGRAKYKDDLTGEGAKLFGGRWNHKGVPALYTSASRALALVEYSVNVAMDDIPRALSMTVFEIDSDDILEIPETELPGDWKNSPAPASTKDFGSSLLASRNNLVLRIPSVVIPEEFNLIINPHHDQIDKVKILETGDFVYDLRIKRK